MDKIKKHLILFLVISMLISCQNRSNKSASNLCDIGKCKIYNEDHIFQEQLFPFSFKGFKTSKLSRFFSKDTKIDSSELNNQGYISHIFDFSDGKSKISFFVKPNDKTDTWFYLKTSSIRSDILTFKNGVKVGMNKSDFNKILKMDCQCDTFLVQEGDMVMSFYFIFNDNSLQKIDIIAPEE